MRGKILPSKPYVEVKPGMVLRFRRFGVEKIYTIDPDGYFVEISKDGETSIRKSVWKAAEWDFEGQNWEILYDPS